jgi:hypothetical protein
LILPSRVIRPGLLFAAPPFLAGVYSAFETAAPKSEQHGFSWLDAIAYEVVPRVGFGLVLAVAVYLIVRAIDAWISHLRNIALAAQVATRAEQQFVH